MTIYSVTTILGEFGFVTISVRHPDSVNLTDVNSETRLKEILLRHF